MNNVTRCLLIALVMAATTTQFAHAEDDNVRHKFGSVSCQAQLPCGGDMASISTEELANNASTCLTGNLGLSSPEGFFDLDAGLNENNCLHVNPKLLANKTPKKIFPLCCVKQQADNTCSFYCEMLDRW